MREQGIVRSTGVVVVIPTQSDFVDATFCVLDSCGHLVLDCNKDDVCREAVRCVPGSGVADPALSKRDLVTIMSSNSSRMDGT